jgi:hypothetical protein
MNAAGMMNRIAEASPRLKARTAGVLFLLLVLTAAFTEFFVRGRLSFAADLAGGIIEVSCMIAVTALFYERDGGRKQRLHSLRARQEPTFFLTPPFSLSNRKILA